MSEKNEAHRNPDIKSACADTLGNRYGELIVRDEEIYARLYSFDGSCPDINQENLVLMLEDAQYATLINCASTSHGSNRYGENLVYASTISPSVTLIGPHAWNENYKVHSFSFTFYGARNALHYGEFSKNSFNREAGNGAEKGSWIDTHIIDHGKLNIMTIEAAPDLSIFVSVAISRTWGIYNRTENHTPKVRVETEAGISIDYALRLAADIVNFFEMSMGHKSRLLDFEASSATSEQIKELLANKPAAALPIYSVRTATGAWEPPQIAHPAEVIFKVYDEGDRKKSQAALHKWIERRSIWKTAYWLSSRYLDDAEIIDRSSVVRLLAWFEAIPHHAQDSEISDAALGRLRRAVRCLPEFNATGISPERLASVLAELKRSPIKKRISDSISYLRENFDISAAPSRLEADCHSAVSYRNISAHGGKHDDELKFIDLVCAIEAVELLCLLSSLRDILPVDWILEKSWHRLSSYVLRSRDGYV